MTPINFIQGNALSIPLADKSVQCVVTSPPYWGLRDYGTAVWIGGDDGCKHNPQRPDGGDRSDRTLPLGRGGVYKDLCKCGAIRKDSQLGLEKTPEEYVANMAQVFREVWRVLRDDGTLWLNLGDSYAADQKGGNKTKPGDKSYTNKGGVGINKFHPDNSGLKPKDLVGIPWRVAFALQADGWYLRSDIIWHKPNPMPESVTDRPTKAHEYVFLLTKSARYYYDAEAVREPIQEVTLRRLSQPNFDNQTGGEKDPMNGGKGSVNRSERRTLENLKERYTKEGVWNDRQTGYELWKEKNIGRNRRSVWTIATAPYSGAHFATFPPALVEPCILAGTSERGACPKCGKPWVRMVEKEQRPANEERIKELMSKGVRSRQSANLYTEHKPNPSTTTGWQPACKCDAGDPIPCVVLDPFSGSGTVGLVARKHNRQFIGIELNAKYIELAKQRTKEIQPVLGGL